MGCSYNYYWTLIGGLQSTERHFEAGCPNFGTAKESKQNQTSNQTTTSKQTCQIKGMSGKNQIDKTLTFSKVQTNNSNLNQTHMQCYLCIALPQPQSHKCMHLRTL